MQTFLRSNHENGSATKSDHHPFSADGASYDPDGDDDGESVATGMETNSLAGVQAELFAGMYF